MENGGGSQAVEAKKNLARYYTPEALSRSLEDVHGIVISPDRLRELAACGHLPCYDIDGQGPYFRPQEAKEYVRANLVRDREVRPFPLNLTVLDPAAATVKPESVPAPIAPLIDQLYEFSLAQLARAGAVYFLVRGGEVVYVGQTNCLAARLACHLGERMKEFDRVLFMLVPESRLDEVELQFIRALRPRYNGARKPADTTSL